MSYLLLALLFALFSLVNSEILVLFELYRYNPMELLLRNETMCRFNGSGSGTGNVNIFNM